MRLLLDTNIFVYVVNEPDSLTSDVLAMLEDCENLKYISTVSIQELITKYRTRGLLTNRFRTERDMVEYIYNSQDFAVDPVDYGALVTLADLRINIAQEHKDPNDHLIIAQAIAHRMTLISSDTKFKFYRQQGLMLVENRF